VWRVIEQLWARIAADRAHAGPILSEGLRAARTLGSKERPVAGDVLTGLMRHARALARIDADPLAAWQRLCEDGVPDLDDPPDAYAIAASVPDDLAAEWWERLGPEGAIAHARTLAGRAPVALRVLREPVDLPVPHRRVGPRAIVLEGRANLHVLDAFRDGHVEVQDLGSQRIVDAAFEGLGPGARVLDLCAGAGGKSLALAALGARVDAWDVRPQALRELSRRAERAGLRIRVGPPRDRYDLVLVDAPCSGTGVLRRHPENRYKLRFPTDTQAALLRDALRLAPRVVYATCSLARRENEELVRSVVGAPVREETIWPGPCGEPAGVADGCKGPQRQREPAGDSEGFYWAEVRG
jgi:16S rRNA C967 or C1407 C5-methylase (RsmB/RsmF family)